VTSDLIEFQSPTHREVIKEAVDVREEGEECGENDSGNSRAVKSSQ
jgi:hypothetical protein